ncbi:exonuclease domain-containing protein [Phthorimaea operculella]|nr:exonuclease domain-containing protein [Phthorimaea operculella]
MPEIASLVFFDIETTGLPFQEKNQTKIIEFSFVATLRKHLEQTSYGLLPPVRRLTFVLNPQRPICAEVTKLTGLSMEDLKKAPTFEEKVKTIIAFLEDLPSPVCLVAHNGNSFDYKILLAEFNDASANLPENLFCVDSLMAFRRILSNSNKNHLNLVEPVPSLEDIMTDDEDEAEWPDLNISTEEWDAIDEISKLSISSDSDAEIIKEKKPKVTKKRSEAIKKVFHKDPNASKDKECYKLTAIYKRLMNKEEDNAHRAEVDCLMLLKCVVALKNEFLTWTDENCKPLTDIKPLIRRYGRFSR